jgi:hypothetical protein
MVAASLCCYLAEDVVVAATLVFWLELFWEKPKSESLGSDDDGMMACR